MIQLSIPTAKVFQSLTEANGARYLGAWGGRGSGKSWFFAEKLVERALLQPGFRAVCVREIQRTLAQSAKRLIEDKIQALGVGSQFRCLYDKLKLLLAASSCFRAWPTTCGERQVA